MWAIVSLQKVMNEHGRRCDTMQLRGTGEGGESGWAFPLPLTRHNLVILSVVYQSLFPTPAITASLMIWTVGGYPTVSLGSFENGVDQTEMWGWGE